MVDEDVPIPVRAAHMTLTVDMRGQLEAPRTDALHDALLRLNDGPER